jgi:cyclic-di-GMP phosphodiesterase, flagellum assembly factor TipF
MSRQRVCMEMNQSLQQPPAAKSWLPVAIAGFGTAAAIGCGLGLPALLGTASTLAVGIGVGVIAVTTVLAGWAAAHEDRQALLRRVGILEKRMTGMSGVLDRLQGDTAQGDDASAEVAGELRVLRELLSQVVTRRNDLPSRDADMARIEPTIETPQADALRPDVLAIMQSALEDSRVDLYLQPTVKLPNRKPASYEAFSRVRDANGDVIYPSEYLETAERAGLVGTLDNLLLFRCISLVRELGVRKPGPRLFINIAAGSLDDPDFLHEFTAYMSQHKDLAQRLVFELSATAVPTLSDSVRRHLGALARLGFPFSVDHVQDLNLDVAKLAALNVQYVKIDASVLLHAATADDAAALKAKLARYSIDVIATRIEEERVLVEVLDLGIDYGQGYLFGEPKLAKPALPQAMAA